MRTLEGSRPEAVWLSDVLCRDPNVAGGKGSSLSRMTFAELPVPRGYVLPPWVLADQLDTRQLAKYANCGQFADAQALVREVTQPRDSVAGAYEVLGGSVAVRSSACVEDGGDASYAGQQETYLGVEGADAVWRAVVDCWASFFSERALAYRRRMDSLAEVSMAVVVQQMIEPDKAGVLFTRDPVNQRRDRMVVEAVRGRGERLVSGENTPDHYSVSVDGSVKHQILVDDGLLSDSELIDLTNLGNRLEHLFGTPQDAEWIISQGKLHVVQSRPITTLH